MLHDDKSIDAQGAAGQPLWEQLWCEQIEHDQRQLAAVRDTMRQGQPAIADEPGKAVGGEEEGTVGWAIDVLEEVVLRAGPAAVRALDVLAGAYAYQSEELAEVIDAYDKLSKRRTAAFSIYSLLEVCDHRLKGNRLRAFLYLRFRRGAKADSWVGLKQMASHLGMTPRALSRIMRSLHANGFLTSKRRLGTSSKRCANSTREIYAFDRIDRQFVFTEGDGAGNPRLLRSLDKEDLTPEE